jgi:hypothetical protein
MKEEDLIIAELLSAHADQLAKGNMQADDEVLALFPDRREELAPLIEMATKLRSQLSIVHPDDEFERHLKAELLESARKRLERLSLQHARQRTLVIIGGITAVVVSAVGVILAYTHMRQSQA